MSTLPLYGTKLFIVEDDPEIRGLLQDLLTGEGAVVHTAKDSYELNQLLRKETPDLIILDLMLPGEDGLSICRRLRTEHNMPILILSARGQDIDRIIGLEIGADDYMPKPFNPRELTARIKAILRRAKGEIITSKNGNLDVSIFQIDIGARYVATKDGQKVTLTSLEFELFLCFAKNAMIVLSRDQLLDWTRGRTSDPTDRTIDVQVSRLRKKLISFGAPDDLIQTIRNGGYMLATKVKKA